MGTFPAHYLKCIHMYVLTYVYCTYVHTFVFYYNLSCFYQFLIAIFMSNDTLHANNMSHDTSHVNSMSNDMYVACKQYE